MFTSAKRCAEYMSERLKAMMATSEANRGEAVSPGMADTHIYVVMGDAHDFHLHDSVNAEYYAGAISIQPRDKLPTSFRKWLEQVC